MCQLVILDNTSIVFLIKRRRKKHGEREGGYWVVGLR
jgi:hypothetical protein